MTVLHEYDEVDPNMGFGSKLGPLNNTCPEAQFALETLKTIREREGSKKFDQQGHSYFGTWSVQRVREDGKMARRRWRLFSTETVDDRNVS